MNLVVLKSLLSLALTMREPLKRTSLISTVCILIEEYAGPKAPTPLKPGDAIDISVSIAFTELRFVRDHLHALNYSEALRLVTDLHARFGDFLGTDGFGVMPQVRSVATFGTPIFFVDYLQESSDTPALAKDNGKDGEQTIGEELASLREKCANIARESSHRRDLIRMMVIAMIEFDVATSTGKSADKEYEQLKMIFNAARTEYGIDLGMKELEQFPICPGATCKRSELEQSAIVDANKIRSLGIDVHDCKTVSAVRLDLLRNLFNTMTAFRDIFPAEPTDTEADSYEFKNYADAYDQAKLYLEGQQSIEDGSLQQQPTPAS